MKKVLLPKVLWVLPNSCFFHKKKLHGEIALRDYYLFLPYLHSTRNVFGVNNNFMALAKLHLASPVHVKGVCNFQYFFDPAIDFCMFAGHIIEWILNDWRWPLHWIVFPAQWKCFDTLRVHQKALYSDIDIYLASAWSFIKLDTHTTIVNVNKPIGYLPCFTAVKFFNQ